MLQNYLTSKYYTHFVSLFCAVRICSAKPLLRHLNVAKLLFDEFISDFKKLYGSQFVTMNLHNLNHITEGVSRYGVLQSISAYPFENALFLLKRMLRPGKNPLNQIAKRLSERVYMTDYNFKEMARGKCDPIIAMKRGFCEIRFEDFKLSNSKFEDMWFSTKNHKVLKMVGAYQRGTEFFTKALEMRDFKHFFEKPFKSTFLDIYQMDEMQQLQEIEKNTKQITCKFVCLHKSIPNSLILVPLLHTMK